MAILASSRSHGNTHNSNGNDPTNQATESVRGIVELATNAETDAGLVVQANDTRLTNSRSPLAHATSHKTGGTDVIKLDELAAPDDNTNLNASIAKHGLLQKGDNDTSHFLNGALQFVSLPAGQGEVNTSSNVGAGKGLAKAKSGFNLPFKTILEGTDIGITEQTDTITISYTGSGGGGGGGEGDVTLLARQTMPIDVKSTTSEVNILNYSLVGGMGANDILEIELDGSYRNNNFEQTDERYFVRLRIGDVIVWQDDSGDRSPNSTRRPVTAKIRIANRNSVTSQFIGGRWTLGNPVAAAVGGVSDLGEDEISGDSPINVTSSRNLGITTSIRLTIQHENSSSNISFIADLITLKLVSMS